MKAGTHNHLKTKRLKRLLGIPLYRAVGILETLWLLCIDCCDEGNIGKFTDEEIADYLEWDGDASELVRCLSDSGWIDPDEEERLVVHDWSEHCPEFITDRLRKRQARGAKKRKQRTYVSSSPDNSGQNRTNTENDASCPEMSGTVPSMSGQCNSIPTNTNQDNSIIGFSQAFQMFWDCYPARRRVKKELAITHWHPSVAKVVEIQNLSADAAESWLINRCKQFAKSAVAKGEFCPGCDKWLENGRYFDSDEAWADERQERWT